MPLFTIRVELHNADEKMDYDKLHYEMGKLKFTRTIETTDGRLKLPTAEYSIAGNYTKKQVLDLAIEAATKTIRSFEVLVTESVGDRMWYNLPPA